MIEVTVKHDTVSVNMHGTAYTLNNAADVAEFKADMGWFSTFEQLVEKYLSKLQRTVKRVAAAVLIAAADVALYLKGKAPLTFWQEQKLRWCN